MNDNNLNESTNEPIKHICDEIKDEYKQWTKGNLIFITSGTGTGKTYFIKNELNTYCLKRRKTILYLTNRDNLKNQILNDIGTGTAITVLNYQKVEAYILHNIQLDNFDYVVMDEAHYYFTESAFNCKTNLFFNRMLQDKSICKILMTATPILLRKYFKEKEITINYQYEIKTDYSYLKEIMAFDTYESVDSIIENIPKDEQIIFFTSAKRAYETAKKYNGTFICSQHNKDGLYQYVKDTENENELNCIIENGYFNNHLLCCTTALDNGINIKEGTPVKHIIIDILDRDIFIQCLGRKRISAGEKVNLYFYSYKDNKKINGLKSKIVNSLDRADYLLKNGQKEYVEKKYKNEYFTDTRIIDEIIDNNGNIQKIVNECIYLKYKTDLIMYNSMLDKIYKNTFTNIIAIALGIEKEDIIEMEVTMRIYTLEEALESVIGKELYKDEQKEVIEFIGLKDARGRLQKAISLLNAYLESNKLPYIILSKTKKDENKKSMRFWVIEKLILDK